MIPEEIHIVDVETAVVNTSLDNYDPINCSICEIGIVKLHFKSGKIETILQKICQEEKGCNPNSWAFTNTSLTYEDVCNSDFLSTLRPEIQSIFKNKIPVTSWSHDFDFVQLEHPSRGFNIPVKFWDPKITLTDFLKIPNPYHFGYKWPRVDEAYKYFFPDVEFSHSHRSIEDAKAETSIIFKSIQKWPILLEKWKDFV